MSNASSESVATTQKAPWNPIVGVVYTIVVFYVCQLLAGILISIYPLLHHWSNGQATDWINNSVPAQFFFILMAETFSITAVFLFLRHYKVKMNIIGLKRPKLFDVAYALIGAVVYYVIFLTVLSLVTHFVPSFNAGQQQQIGFNSVHGGLQLVLTFASLVVLPPLAEEIMLRGLIFTSLRKALPLVQAGLITSVIFAAAHLPEGGSSGPLWIGALDTFILSLVLVYLREKTQSLAASMMLHAIKNGLAYVALFIWHVS